MGADDVLGLIDDGGVGVGGIGEYVAGEVAAFEGVVGSIGGAGARAFKCLGGGAGAESSGVALVLDAGVRAGMEVAGGAGEGVIAGELGIPEEGFAEGDGGGAIFDEVCESGGFWDGDAFEGLELAGEDANGGVGVGQEAGGVDDAGCEGVNSGGEVIGGEEEGGEKDLVSLMAPL